MSIPTIITTNIIRITNKFNHDMGSYIRLERVGDGDILDRTDYRNITRQQLSEDKKGK